MTLPSHSPACAASPASSPADHDGPRRRGKRLQKRRPDEDESQLPDLPEPLKGSDSDDEDSPNDPISGRGRAVSVNMNQSIFGLIAAAGSRVDFNARFDDGSSDEEGGPEASDGPQEDLSQTVILPPRDKKSEKRHRRKLSSSRLLHSLSHLPKLKHKAKREASRASAPPEASDDAGDSSDMSQTPALTVEDADTRLAPVMSRMLQARAEIASRPSFDLERRSTEVQRDEVDDDTSPLAKRLMEIFEFDSPEEVVEEYPCWLLQSVLLQGFLYITSRHICFYAYLPKKANEVAKAGYLSKSGRRNPKYHRYWFRLKGDVLSYYRDSTDLYFPHGQVDLRFGISANITDGEKDGTHFNVVTSHRTYNFKADSAPSAKEWVKSLQRVIFRSHNEGDSVKISLPMDNVIDVEETQMMQFSETCKIRVFDNDETYAIDEVRNSY